MVYEKHDYYLKRKRWKYEIKGILWKKKTDYEPCLKNVEHFLVA
jgi:hypothetical protein